MFHLKQHISLVILAQRIYKKAPQESAGKSKSFAVMHYNIRKEHYTVSLLGKKQVFTYCCEKLFLQCSQFFLSLYILSFTSSSCNNDVLYISNDVFAVYASGEPTI